MRILFVAMAESIHAANWVKQLAGTGWDVHLFDATASGVGLELSGVTAHTVFRSASPTPHLTAHHSALVFTKGRNPITNRLLQLMARCLPSRAQALAELIRQFKPDVVHSLEMQHESYVVLEAKRLMGAEFSMPWIYSSWGSDLYLYGDDPCHRDRVRAVLEACNYFISDCRRDVTLAKQLGFKGDVLGVFPGAGGFDLCGMRQHRMPGLPSARRVIALKGCDGWAGRARTALHALRQCADQLDGYTVELFSAGKDIQTLAKQLSKTTGLPIRVLPHCARTEIVKMMGRARVIIGLSISDGTPNTMLEAMIMGALPIQTDAGGATGEWITDGENGLIVPPEDVDLVAAAIRRALGDDALIDRAMQLNEKLANERLDDELIRSRVIARYEMAGRQAHPDKEESC